MDNATINMAIWDIVCVNITGLPPVLLPIIA